MISLQAFREWAVAKKQVSNPQVGTYPGQCVSLVQQLLFQVFEVPYARRGNAKDFVPPGFTKLPGNTPLRPGDIVRYGANYGGGYGHIALIDDEGKFLDQNGIVALHVGRRNTPFGGIESVWRPAKAFNVKTAPTYGMAQAIRQANVRVAPYLNAALGGSKVLQPGETFMYRRLVTGDTVTQNGITSNQWVESQFGRFVWAGNIKLLS